MSLKEKLIAIRDALTPSTATPQNRNENLPEKSEKKELPGYKKCYKVMLRTPDEEENKKAFEDVIYSEESDVRVPTAQKEDLIGNLALLSHVIEARQLIVYKDKSENVRELVTGMTITYRTNAQIDSKSTIICLGESEAALIEFEEMKPVSEDEYNAYVACMSEENRKHILDTIKKDSRKAYDGIIDFVIRCKARKLANIPRTKNPIR